MIQVRLCRSQLTRSGWRGSPHPRQRAWCELMQNHMPEAHCLNIDSTAHVAPPKLFQSVWANAGAEVSSRGVLNSDVHMTHMTPSLCSASAVHLDQLCQAAKPTRCLSPTSSSARARGRRKRASGPGALSPGVRGARGSEFQGASDCPTKASSGIPSRRLRAEGCSWCGGLAQHADFKL